MKNYITFGFCMIMLLMATQEGFSQRKKKRPSKNKEVKVEKLTLIELEKGKNKYPSSYLRKVQGDSLYLYSTIKLPDKSITYTQKSILLGDFDKIKITNKKERLRKSLLWGFGIGAVSYFVTQKYANNPAVVVGSSSVFPKAGSSGIVEGLNAGLVGFGVGIILYNQILHTKMDIKDQKKEILKKLKDY